MKILMTIICKDFLPSQNAFHFLQEYIFLVIV